MHNESSPLKEAAMGRYNEIDGILRRKMDEIESLKTEHSALKAYLISMNLLQEEVIVKRRGRKPKDKSGAAAEKKTPGRKAKAKPDTSGNK